MNDLERIRQSINQYDQEIMKQLFLRFEAVKEIVKIKKEQKMPIFDSGREKYIIQGIKEKNDKYAQEISEIYENIMDVSRKYQSMQLLPDKIFLIGFMGSGKTTIGKLLSQIAGFTFIDTDQMIEENTNMKIYDIFHQKGEEYFRQIEAEVLNNLKETRQCIISCGGGIILQEENRSILKKEGKTVFLNGSIKHIIDRIDKNNDRPILAPFMESDSNKKYGAAQNILDSRMPYYMETAHIIIDTDHKKPEEIAEEIFQKIV